MRRGLGKMWNSLERNCKELVSMRIKKPLFWWDFRWTTGWRLEELKRLHADKIKEIFGHNEEV
jgi:hypothetical protein